MRMPVLFVGHGNPMNAIQVNPISETWQRIGKSLKANAICCISAHWLTRGVTAVTAMGEPRTIHDFFGFPEELFTVHYPAPGSQALANEIKSKINDWPIELDMNWGLDHGTWSVLRHLFPDASVPVIQLSIDYYQEPEFYFNFGKLLRFLRDQNVLLIGSGNIVHNLGRMTLDDSASDWAIEFDRLIKQLIDQRDFQKLIDFKNLSDSKLAIPTAEHYLPLLYILGALDADDEIEWFNEVCMNSSISMRSFVAK